MSVLSAGECHAGISTYSVLRLGLRPRGRVRFPGRDVLSQKGTAGYVRSPRRAALAVAVARQSGHLPDPLPWRDYPGAVLSPARSLIEGGDTGTGQIVIGARNTLNEFGYQARLDGHWWRRLGDGPLPGEWPVLAFGRSGLDLCPLAQAVESSADIVTGIPLVVRGVPRQRPFFLAHCSDVAHVFTAHPGGLLGPSANPSPQLRQQENAALWMQLSTSWQEWFDQGLSEAEFAHRMEAIGRALGAAPSRNLLHSLVAIDRSGCVLAFAVTGSLDGIASHLCERWGVRDSVLLDNGGSVGWWYRSPGVDQALLLVAGPNYRPQGTVFLDFGVDEFLHPIAHAALDFEAP